MYLRRLSNNVPRVSPSVCRSSGWGVGGGGVRRQDKAAAALSDAEKCVSVEPSWAKGYSRMGTALFRLGRHAQAAAAYSKGKPQAASILII